MKPLKNSSLDNKNSDIHILICDDSPAVHESLAAYLHAEGFSVDSVYDGESALKTVLDGIQRYDCVVLDVMLPKMFGTDVCREIRRISTVPIIMLSARGEEYDRIIGLELGADDYVPKPFSPREVCARIRNILKRSLLQPAEHKNEKKAGNITIDMKSFTARIGSEQLDLTAKEISMLVCFTDNNGCMLSREQLLEKVWGGAADVDTRAVDTLVKRLRKKIEKYNTGIELISQYGIGYKMEIRI